MGCYLQGKSGQKSRTRFTLKKRIEMVDWVASLKGQGKLIDSIQLKLLDLAPQMIDPNIVPNQQVYGFLCQQTNVFYAFDSYETYQQFVEWMDSQSRVSQEQPTITEELREGPQMDEEQQLANFELATEQILSVFDDPIFQLTENQTEMREIDF